MPAETKNVIIRDAREEDVPTLGAFKEGETFHRDRLRDADGAALRYLVAEIDGQVVAHGLLALKQPATWPKMKHLPQMIDLFVRPDLRSRGIGRALIARMEVLARAAGCAEMRLGVDPDNNPRALALYRALGYIAIDTKPVRDRWEYIDSAGVRHGGVEWIIHMKKPLSPLL